MDLKQGFGLVGAVGVTLSVGACTSVDGSSPAASASAPPSAAVSSNAAAQTPSAATPAAAPESSSAPATSAGAASSEAAASSAPASDPLGSGQQGLVTTKVGAEAKTSKLSVKVTKVVDPVPVGDSAVFKPGAGKKWAAVSMTVTNVGGTPINFSPSMCIDAKTTTNGSASASLFADYGSPMDSSTLHKGDAASGDVTFELPKNQKLKSVDVRCSLDFAGDQRTIRVDLAH
ncbi:DUF4352 domain-containing protein [Dermacoccus nishinomiyaensis]|uniref:DUF4352 domain-containing protein n=1 Tax=Dermacoccus nishinomiyaensis TaxID=1274 RepID=UPI000E07093D|nr:DUF4352 domain-containing protein [Dermacoccus nishinomiyaensis]QQY24236.1 DUF4352 domain-containing protein [Dermacoccus nishinomiyaensis]STD71296.1 Telomeric repeat-binding factor 2 [Dermacoccus nishinomiyaensis]